MAVNKTTKSAPEPTLRRLPRYLHLLFRLREGGLKSVSSTLIARELSLDPTQVRKDIEYTQIIGRPKTGYPIDELIKAIETFLNWNNINDAFLVGCGNLGTAMLGYQRFKKYGLNFVAAFDTDQNKIGSEIHGITILSIDKLPELAERMHIHFGVLTVPPQYAQFTAEIMVEGGIKAIWNFAPCQLKLPEDIIVENAQLTQSLAVISRKLHEYKEKNKL